MGEKRFSRLWYRREACDWESALPLGNGRLGAMVFGGIQHERIELNHEAVWARVPGERENPKALQNLDKIRRLIMSGEPGYAEFLADSFMMGCPSRLQPYQQLACLTLSFILPLDSMPERY
ncbi:MAG: glycoside hydrolase N-terminal domain-containing protein, partial [Victivallales bacterium]|nr:glycoside hydrolase N-terminal domain-containing protein [Victivallales bacterium]